MVFYQHLVFIFLQGKNIYDEENGDYAQQRIVHSQLLLVLECCQFYPTLLNVSV